MYSDELDCIIALENADCKVECCYQEKLRSVYIYIKIIYIFSGN